MCLLALLLVGVLIESSWCTVPPPASAFYSPHSQGWAQNSLSGVRRNSHSPETGNCPSSLPWPDQGLGTEMITAVPASPLVSRTLVLPV